MPVAIRPARSSDHEFIVDCNSRLAIETESKRLDPAKVGAGVAAALASAHKGRYFIAELDGRPAGQLMLTSEWSDWRNGSFWWIQSVYVHAFARRQGVFTALFRHVERLASDDPGVCGLRLYVEQDNQIAHRTYRRLGLDVTHYSIMELEFPGRGAPKEASHAQAR
jgi:ribosomal protein S18 acetylase RimI-like enzyme